MVTKNNDLRHVLLVVRHPVGGIRTYMKYVYKKPYFENHQFTIVFPDSDLTDMFKTSITDIKTDYRICDSNIRSMALCIYSVLKKENICLVHSHGFTSGICATLPARMKAIPHLMTAHDVLLDKQFTGYKGEIKRSVMPVLFNMIDGIHAVSHDVRRNLEEMLPGLKTDKFITILNGIDVSLYEHDRRRDLHIELGVPRDNFIIGFLGRFMSQKGFRYLIDAVAILDKDKQLPKQFIVATVGSGGFIREEKELINKKRLAHRFAFLPPVEDVSATIKGMDVIAMPSLWEACGLLAMETLVSGVPLIATNCIGLREVIEGSPAFRLESADGVSLAATIKECMFNDKADEFQSYRAIAAKRFDSRNTTIDLAKLYNRMISPYF